MVSIQYVSLGRNPGYIWYVIRTALHCVYLCVYAGKYCLQSDRVASQNERFVYLFIVFFMLYCFVFVNKYVM
jgi:hypothetical protein